MEIIFLSDKDMIEAVSKSGVQLPVVMRVDRVHHRRDIGILKAHEGDRGAVIEPHNHIRLKCAWQKSNEIINVNNRMSKPKVEVGTDSAREHGVSKGP